MIILNQTIHLLLIFLLTSGKVNRLNSASNLSYENQPFGAFAATLRIFSIFSFIDMLLADNNFSMIY